MQIGFFGALTLILITLKLIGYITISWLWVLSPIWLPLIIFFIAFTIYCYKNWGKK